MKFSISLIIGFFLLTGCALVTKNDRYTIDMNTDNNTYLPSSLNILINDIDIEGTMDSSTIQIVQNVTHGVLSVNRDAGTVLYTPTEFYQGNDLFRYTVSNISGEVSNVSTVSLTIVGAINQKPIAHDDQLSVTSGSTGELKILDNDSDADGSIDITGIELFSLPDNGTLNYNQSTGVLLYTANDSYFGEDSFTYRVKDNSGTFSNEANVLLTVLSARKSLTPVELKADNWYMALEAEVVGKNLKTKNSKLGALSVQNAVLSHTLKALQPFGGDYIDIIFQNPNGVAAGEYKTNFHTYTEGIEERWSFMVKTDNINADILLSWRGLYVLTPYIDSENRTMYRENISHTNPLLKYMKLIDNATGEEVSIVLNGKMQSYAFNMNGQSTHTFEWVVGINEVILGANTKFLQLEVNKMKKVIKANKFNHINTFDLSKPPMLKEN